MVLLLAACAPPAPIALPPTVLAPGVDWAVPVRVPLDRWPTVAASDAGLDAAALEALDAYSFRRDGDDVDRKGQRTNALLIVRHGAVVHERYARDTTAATPLLTWSVTKSVGNVITGTVVHGGGIQLDDPACKHYPPMCGGGREHVRITDLLRMSSGLSWLETYEASPVFSSVTGMLYTRGSEDMAGFAASQPPKYPAGVHWRYSSGDSNIVSAALKQPLGERYAEHPFTAVFEPLGMHSAVLEADAAGTHVTSSYLYATARDLARVGQLMLDDGVWNGERLLPEGWVRYSTTLAPAFHTTPIDKAHLTSNPGAQWYVNRGDPDRGLDPPWPTLPPDAFGASGHWGKAMWVVPSWDAVIVRLGDDREYGCTATRKERCATDPEAAFTKTLFLEKLAAAVRPHAVPPLPEPIEPEVSP